MLDVLFRRKNAQPEAVPEAMPQVTMRCSDAQVIRLQNIHLYSQLALELAESSMQKEYLQIMIQECEEALRDVKNR